MKKSKVHIVQVKLRFDRHCSRSVALREARNCLSENMEKRAGRPFAGKRQ